MDMNIPINPVRRGTVTRFLPLLSCLFLLFFPPLTHGAIKTAETTYLKVTLNTMNAALTVTDKSPLNGDVVWTQDVKPNFYVDQTTFVQISARRFTATIIGPDGSYDIDLTVENDPGLEKAFHLQVTPDDPLTTDPYPYVTLPPYPFKFTQSGAAGPWYYVQNNGGEGTLLPVGDSKIRGFGGWSGGQPWWGITNLNQAMMARLDSFTRVQNPTMGGDSSAYRIPVEIEYSFYRTGGYVGLAKAYRAYFLSQIDPSLTKLAIRASSNPKLNYLKDSTYAYFWDDYQPEFESLVFSMKSSGLGRMIAMFNQKDFEDRVTMATFNYLASSPSPWLGGVYRTPTPNLDKICDIPGIPDWVGSLLLHQQGVTEEVVLLNDLDQWDELYSVTAGDKWEMGNSEDERGIPYNLTKYGSNLKVIYQDTLPQQLGPCVYDPDFRESIEDNQTGRQHILDITHQAFPLQPLGFVSGSGEGISAWWTVSHLDYWEGGMEESVYGDITRHPIDDHDEEFASNDFIPEDGTYTWYAQETDCLLEEERIPLLALQWHDYVAQTWNWRNSTFVVQSLSWKKDLFNILYCAMPMWHVNKTLWTAHLAEYIASYKKLFPVRQANGFAEMTNHGWLTTADRSVQYTDWDNGNRVIVNFGGSPYPYTDNDGTPPDYGSATIPAKGYEMLPDTTAPAPVPTFTATGGNTIVTLNWTHPPDGDLVSVKIKRSTNTFPTWTTGTEIYNGPALTRTDTGLTNNRRYYYSAFAIDGKGNYSAAATASATPRP